MWSTYSIVGAGGGQPNWEERLVGNGDHLTYLSTKGLDKLSRSGQTARTDPRPLERDKPAAPPSIYNKSL